MTTDPAWWTAPPPRSGPLVHLEPLTADHAEGWFAAAQATGPEAWAWLSRPFPRTLGDARADIGAALAAQEAGTRLPLAQLDAVSGAFLGTTSYYAPDPTVRSVAVGFTWLTGSVQGRGHNADSKRQMLEHAFTGMGAEVVIWHTDALNTRSRAAIQNLGARHDGVLRHHKRRPDGSVRDTACFSMLVDEWPAARTRIEERVRSATG
ncbi:GNAT family N-acetyltransferase [Kytococcus schroeteri]|uniref:GNAT family N-acetyltransferase n=1 Tax=Kytococcus schroeteri TaxID=138300 RepID=UPI0011445F91|nr:GNAT family protein [Kytococcus schroeteri]